MRAAIIAVGSEMLGLTRLDTNSLDVTRYFEEWGVKLALKSVVGDDLADLEREIAFALGSHDIVVITGGLGPTEDDVTKEAVSNALGLSMHEDPEVLRRIQALFETRGYAMPETNRKQALVFTGQRTLANPRGTAPAFHLAVEWNGAQRHLWIFPGVPNELRGLLENEFDPWLRGLGLKRRFWRTLKVTGLPESTVDQKLRPFYEAHRDRPVTILAGKGEIQLHFYAEGGEDAAYTKLNEMEEEVRAVLGERVYGAGDDTLETLVGRWLTERGETVSTAESCTGGLVSTRITDVSGSSVYFLGGAVAYSAPAKMAMIGVDPEHIEKHGEVSEEVARDLAEGARRRFGSTYGIGITGIAGPTGGSEAKPVGTVHIAVASRAGIEHRKLYFAGGRQNVRLLASQAALDLMRMVMMA